MASLLNEIRPGKTLGQAGPSRGDRFAATKDLEAMRRGSRSSYLNEVRQGAPRGDDSTVQGPLQVDQQCASMV